MFVYDSLQLNEPPVTAPVKVTASEAGPSKTPSPPKASLSPGTEADSTSGEMSSSSWVMDNSGFLSPAGPALKEVLEMVDGVCVRDYQQLACLLPPRHSYNLKMSRLQQGPGRLVQPGGLRPARGQSEPRAPPVSPGGQHLAGAEQKQ